jgi:hypothetical protein
MRVRHGNVGLVEGGANLAAVDTMADMAVDQPRFLEWLIVLVSLCTEFIWKEASARTQKLCIGALA